MVLQKPRGAICSRLWCRLHLPCQPFPGCTNVISCGNILYKVLMLACLRGNGQLYLIEPDPREATKELSSDRQPKAQLKISTPSEWGAAVFEAVSEIRRNVWSKCAFSSELQPAAGQRAESLPRLHQNCLPPYFHDLNPQLHLRRLWPLRIRCANTLAKKPQLFIDT
jgi:hypothetical protein